LKKYNNKEIIVSKRKLPPKIKIHGRTWKELALKELTDYAPEIRICGGCGYPHLAIFCCNYCGADNPDDPLDPWGTGELGRMAKE
jgi:hypothetical protein